MSDAYDMMLTGYDDVEASHGFDGEPLPAGSYALKVEKILDAAPSKTSGVPMVRMQLLVTERHPDAAMVGRRTWVSMALGASSKNRDGQLRDAAAMAKATSNVQAQMKGWLGVLGVSTSTPSGTGVQKVVNFYNVGAWEGREFVGKIALRPKTEQYEASNQLNSFHSLQDEKRGLEWLRAQVSTASTSSSSSTHASTTPTTI